MSQTVPPSSASLLHLARQRDYALFWTGRLFGSLAVSAQAVTIAWEVYAIARRAGDVREAAFAVGMIGLVQFLPMFALTLTAGETADRRDRKSILVVCLVLQLVTACALALHSAASDGLWPMFAIAALFGAARAFFTPCSQATGPMLVPIELLPRAIAANSLAMQVSGIAGPALGGLLCAISPALAYGVCAALYGLSAFCMVLIRGNTRPTFTPGRSRSELIREGLAYIWSNKIILGAISLDLFAVLLASATALLPVFAKDVLHVGPEGFGALRAAPAVGALAVAAWLAMRPIRTRAGLRMFLAVGLFGLLTIAFGLSRSFPLSLAILAMLGAVDMVSVFVRHSLIQLSTPDAMRGRVSAVSALFIGASNELGEFETGVVARLVGPVTAVIAGGAASVAVTALWAGLFPSLRKIDRLV